MKKILSMFFAVLVVVLGFNFMKSEEKVPVEREMVTVEHLSGTTEVPKNPKNLVVFDYGLLDTIDYLDVEVKGVVKESLPKFLSKYRDEKYEAVGGLKEPDFEKIFAIKPELIIISGRQEPFYKQLSEIAPTIYLTTTGDDYIVNFRKNHEILGRIFGKEKELTEAVARVEKRIGDLKTKVDGNGFSGLVTLSNNGKISAYGEDSRFGVIHRYFGFTPLDEIKGSNHGSSVTFEYVLEKNPDFLFVVDRSAVAGGDVLANQSFNNSIIQATDAFKNNRIVFLDAEIWYVSTGGITSTERMLAEMEVLN